MKRFLILTNLVFVASIGFAQMKVVNTGNAAIGTSPNTDAKLLMQSATLYSVYLKNTGVSQTNVYTTGNTFGIYTNNSAGAGNWYSGNVYGVYSDNNLNTSYSGEVYGAYLSAKTTGTSSARTMYGLYSTVSGSTEATRYAGYFTGGKVVVMNGSVGINTTTPREIFQIGDIWTFHNGSTKYIGKNAAWDYATNTTNRRIIGGHACLISFANGIQMETFGDGVANSALVRKGYLVLSDNGNVGIDRDPDYKLDVNGTIRVVSTLYSSDERLKSNIKDLENEAEKLYKLQGKSYTKTTVPSFETENGAVREKRDTTQFFEYGYLAQELKEVFPELVSQDSAGYYSVNYVALIPVIIEALKDQQKTIATLQQKLEGKETASNALKSGEITATQNMYLSDAANAETLKLYQNAPNPFNERTTVKCFVPQNIQKVQLCVYNMQGVQVQCITIVERGNVEISIEARTLSAGIYSYVLLGDGTASETKQMILTK
ncbi:MAG: tail fiber domain-containing protein [Bacteroidetes bacterium]|nr:tail fiber domain-containing protein [Bacteroidota bacterium]